MSKTNKKKETPAWLHRFKYHTVFAFAFLLYANTIPNKYNLDDELVVTTDPQQPHRLTSKGISAIAEIFTEPYYQDNQGYAYDYRPMVLLSYAIEHSFFGDNPNVSHFFNALFYALLCVLLLRVLLTLFATYSPWLSIFTVMLFVAHPVHTEVVASIKNRDEILAMGFGLLALLLAFKAAVNKKWLWIPLSLAVYFIALLSKQSSIYFALFIPIALLYFSKSPVWLSMLYSILAVIVYTPVSGFTHVGQAVQFASLFLAVLIIISIRLWMLNVDKFRPINFNDIKLKFWSFSSFQISITQFSLIAILVAISAGLLNFFSFSNWIFPGGILLIAAALVDEKLQVKAHLVSAAILATLLTLDSMQDTIIFIMPLYFSILLYERKEIYFRLIPVALVAIRVLKEITFPMEIILVGVTFFYNSIPYQIGKTVYRIFFLIGVFLLFYFPVAQGFSVKELTLAVSVLLFAAHKEIGIKRAKFGLLFLLASAFFFNTRNHFTPVNPTLALNNPVIQIVERAQIDRPVNYVESVLELHTPLTEKLGTAVNIFLRYTKIAFVPWPLSFYYGYSIIEKTDLFSPIGLLGATLFLLLLGGALYFARSHPVLSFGLFIYLIGITTYSGLVVTVPGMMADRFLFVPVLGFILAAVYTTLFFFKSLKEKDQLEFNLLPKNLRYGLLGVLILYSVLTIARNHQWKNHLTLFSADINHLKESAQANNLYALQLMRYSYLEEYKDQQKEMQQKAESHFAQALRVYPDFVNAQYDLARVQSILGKTDEAEKSFYKAALLNPTYPPTWQGAIEIAMSRKRFREARNYCISGIDSLPNDIQLYNQWGFTYYAEGKFDSANVINRMAAEKFPESTDFLVNIGQTYITVNKIDSADYYLRLAIQKRPDDQRLRDVVKKISNNRIQ